jgi:hypothetical protein
MGTGYNDKGMVSIRKGVCPYESSIKVTTKRVSIKKINMSTNHDSIMRESVPCCNTSSPLRC